MSEKIKMGDVVRLRSGGPWMTVTYILDNNLGVNWFDGKKLRNATTSAASLQKSKKKG